MTPSADPKARRRLIVLIIAGLLVLVLAGIGVYGLITGPAPRPDAPDGGNDPAPPATAPSAEGHEAPELEPVGASDDPEEFARDDSQIGRSSCRELPCALQEEMS